MTRRDQGRRNGIASRGDRRPAEPIRNTAVKSHAVGEDKLPGTTDAPAVSETAFIHRLARGGAAEHHRLRHDQRTAGGERDIDAALEARAVEQDGFLRQRGKTRVAAGGLPRAFLHIF
jgi:hypothetical protein